MEELINNEMKKKTMIHEHKNRERWFRKYDRELDAMQLN